MDTAQQQEERYYLAPVADQPGKFHIMDRRTGEVAWNFGLFAGPEGDKFRMDAMLEAAARDWCERWNLVEKGHCGNCKRKVDEIPSYRPGPNGEAPLHTSTFGNNMYGRLCFDCSCALED
jgi:hypothetical protein